MPSDRRRASVLRRSLGRAAGAWLLAAACLLNAGPSRADDLKVGQPAPPLVLHTLDGRSIATSDLKGQVLLVTFWATWCEPCRAEMPLLSAYADRRQAEGVQVLAFSLDGPEDMASVQAVAAGLHFPVGLLGRPWAGGYGRIWRVPVSFVIDRNGRLVYDGWQDNEPTWTEQKLRRVVDPLLDGAAAARRVRDGEG